MIYLCSVSECIYYYYYIYMYKRNRVKWHTSLVVMVIHLIV